MTTYTVANKAYQQNHCIHTEPHDFNLYIPIVASTIDHSDLQRPYKRSSFNAINRLPLIVVVQSNLFKHLTTIRH